MIYFVLIIIILNIIVWGSVYRECKREENVFYKNSKTMRTCKRCGAIQEKKQDQVSMFDAASYWEETRKGYDAPGCECRDYQGIF